MIKLLKTLAEAALFLAFIVGIFFWFEAEKEVRILCSMFHAGQPEAYVTRTLGTGHFLEYRHEQANGEESIRVSTPYTLGSSRCSVLLTPAGTVRSARYDPSFSLNKTAAWIGALGFLCLGILQLLLAAGRPLGHLAWGGRHRVLPAGLRTASGLSGLILLAGFPLLLQRAALLHLPGVSEPAYYATWIFAALFGASYFANRKSQSPVERRWMSPAALLLCCLCIIVSMAG